LEEPIQVIVSDLAARAVSCLGLAVMIAIAWVVSVDRRHIPWRVVASGLGLQLALALLLLKTPVGTLFFRAMNAIVNAMMACTDAGAQFVFGALAETGFSFVVNVLPIILVMGSAFAVLYHLGVLQRIVDGLGRALSRAMGTTGAESLAAVANIFVGMAESALVVAPYLERMTRSELFTLMTVGMATVAGSVMLAYVGILGGGEYAGHLATASLLSAPAGILVAKVMIPELEVPTTRAGARVAVERTSVNVVDAAAQGALAGLRLAAYVGALLIAFVALIAMLNGGLGWLGARIGVENLTFQRVLGVLLAPLAWLMGVPWQDAPAVGALLGVKTVLNEFLAYRDLADLIADGALAPRSAIIASYALCGFANFGSLAILLGGIGGLAPGRRTDVARMGLRSILSGSLAAFMTACVVGMLL
jgi:CNT family concentrative nucleoside transporter